MTYRVLIRTGVTLLELVFATGHCLVRFTVARSGTVPCVNSSYVPLGALTPLFVNPFCTQLPHGTNCTVDTTLMSRLCCKYSSFDVLLPYLMSCRSASLAPFTVISLPVIVNPNSFTNTSLTKNGSRFGTPYLGSPETHSRFVIHCA